MPTWTEAWDAFCKDRDEAMERKEIRNGREEELRSFFRDLSTEEWNCLSGMTHEPVNTKESCAS